MDIENELADMDESPITTGRTRARRGPARQAPPVAVEADGGTGPAPVDPSGLVIEDAVKAQMRLLERRLVNPNVDDDRSIALKDKSLVLRIFNGEKSGRLYHAVHRLGWRPLHVSELDDREQIGDISTTKEGYVVRGEKGRQMFMVMPRDVYKAIQRKKVELRESKQNLHRKGRRDQLDELSEVAAQKFGDQAGEGVRQFRGTNSDGSAVMELDG